MRIQKLRVKRYGALRDWSPIDLPPGVCVVHGPNEAGKSTLFDLLTSLLYGFSPAAADKHPYTSWEDGASLDIEAELVLQDHQTVQVNRRLLSTPRGSLVRGEAAEEIANRPLPFVQHVGCDLYQALYALTAYDFQHLKEKHQAEIQNRLLGGLTTTRIRPVPSVLQELERDANQLWRTDRRRSRYSALSEELRRVRQERQEALKRETELQQHLARLKELQDEHDTLQRERAGLKARVRRAETLVPVAAALKQLDGWRREIADEKRLAALPLDIRGELKRLKDDLVAKDAELADIQEKIRAENEAVASFGDRERLVLKYTGEIREWVRLAEVHDRERRKQADDCEEIRRHRERLGERAGEVLVEPWSDICAGEVKRVPSAELKARITQCTEAREAHRQCREDRLHKEHNAPVAARPIPVWFGLGCSAVGVLLAALGWLGDSVVLLAAAVTSLVVAAGALALGWLSGQASRQLREQYQKELHRLREQDEQAAGAFAQSRDKVAALLAGLPVAPGLLEQPDMGLYESVIALRSELMEIEQLEARLAGGLEKWGEERNGLAALAETLGEPVAEWAVPAVDRLSERLTHAENMKTEHDQAIHELARLKTQQTEGKARLETLREEQAWLEAEILSLAGMTGDADPAVDRSVVLEEAVERVVGLKKTLDLLKHHETELQRLHVDLPVLQEEIRALEQDPDRAWILDATKVEPAKDRLEGLDGRVQELVEGIARLENDIQAHMRGSSPGELDGQIAAIEEELQTLARERDRLVLMRMILKRADREFREQHQPDVLRRAGSYLERITEGRYTRLMMLAVEGGSERLVVQRGDRTEPVTVGHPLSRGTLDQIFLAFRLAVIDHLDNGHETLPLFLDEGLVNWDDARLENGVRLFGEIAAVRQVFLFTCRQALAELVTTRLGEPVVMIPGMT